jgi:hypothetical protein
MYGAGFLLVPAILVLALLPFFASAFLFNKSWAFSGRVYMIASSLLFSAMIVIYYIQEYKPTIYLNVAKDYQGCVFLFPIETESLEDVNVNQHGIAYIPYGGHYHLKIKVDGKKRPEVLNSFNYNQISFYNADSTKIHWVDVSCLEIDQAIDYTTDLYVPRDFNPCMEGSELRMLIDMNQIDSSILKWSFYHYGSDTYFEP